MYCITVKDKNENKNFFILNEFNNIKLFLTIEEAKKYIINNTKYVLNKCNINMLKSYFDWNF